MYRTMPRVKLVSSDLNGTLVYQHTMSDMIRLYIGQPQYEKADEVFKWQTSGTASMEEAFQNAGPLTRGLTLRQAITYTQQQMKYVAGFTEFVDTLAQHNLPLVINSTGYSVTIYAIREQIGPDKIHGHIGNFLRFGLHAAPNETLREDELERMVKEYFADPEAHTGAVYDQIRATGIIDLGIVDEAAKATLIQEYVKRHFPTLQAREIAHMGDTMGDSGGIIGIAEVGGIGIAFNYNDALKEFLNKKIKTHPPPGEIYFVDPKSDSSNVTDVLPVLIRE